MCRAYIPLIWPWVIWWVSVIPLYWPCFLWNEECWCLPLDGFQFYKEFKDTICVSLSWNEDLSGWYFLAAPPWSLHFLPSLISSPIYTLELRKDHGLESFTINKEWRTCHKACLQDSQCPSQFLETSSPHMKHPQHCGASFRTMQMNISYDFNNFTLFYFFFTFQ